VSAVTQRGSPFRDVVKIAAIFFAVGPAVGALTFLMTSMFFSPLGTQAGIYGLGFGLIFGIPVGYFFGGPAAALTGAIVSIASNWITRLRWLYPFAAAVGGACAVGSVFALEMLRTPPPGSVKQPLWYGAVMLAVAGSVAAVVCTWFVKGAYVYKPTDELEPGTPGGGQ
jgi:hypothetical protein